MPFSFHFTRQILQFGSPDECTRTDEFQILKKQGPKILPFVVSKLATVADQNSYGVFLCKPCSCSLRYSVTNPAQSTLWKMTRTTAGTQTTYLFPRRLSSGIAVRLLSSTASVTRSMKNLLSYGKSTAQRSNYSLAGVCVATARNIGTYLKWDQPLFLI